MNKKALITGVTGQDGAYLSKFLLSKGYDVTGTYRPGSTINCWRLEELGIKEKVNLVPMELLEYENINRTIQKVDPDEIYNLAAQSFVSVSFEQPIYTNKVNSIGVAKLLETMRGENIKFYQASTSEMFGNVEESPQSESTAFNPESPYATSKLSAHWLTINYRESYSMHNTNGILFNHESPLRGEHFVTKKITASLARIKRGKQDILKLGNLVAKRDWGFAGDYVRGMWLMLQQDEPDDYVLATGENHSVKEFVETAAEKLDFKLRWEGKGRNARAFDKDSGQKIIAVDEQFFRPVDVNQLKGDYSKAEKVLNWSPGTGFEGLVERMVKHDWDKIKN